MASTTSRTTIGRLGGTWTGLPVVFNHGIGTNLGVWSAWLPIVAARHPVVRFDLRGFGASPVPPPAHKWTMDELVDDLLEVVATAGANKVHLVGELIGGTIVLAAALKAPERFASVSISNASHRGTGITNIQNWQRTFETGGGAAWNAEMMANRFYPDAADPAALAWFAEAQTKSDRHAVLALGVAARRHGSERSAARLQGAAVDHASRREPLHFACPRRRAARTRAELALAHRAASKHGLPFSHAATEAQSLVAFLDEIESGMA